MICQLEIRERARPSNKLVNHFHSDKASISSRSSKLLKLVREQAHVASHKRNDVMKRALVRLDFQILQTAFGPNSKLCVRKRREFHRNASVNQSLSKPSSLVQIICYEDNDA